MEAALNISINDLKRLVQYGLQSNVSFLGEAYYTDTEYIIVSVKEQKLYITAIYQNNILTHMSDVSYATFLDLIGELDYSTDNFKNIIKNYI